MRIVMRFHFPNLDRPKKAAKRIARLLGGALPLSKVQNRLAVALGYRDWHELDLAHASQQPQPLDQDLLAEDFHRRSADLSLKLAKALGVSDSEAQYALLDSRLTGGQATFDDHFAIRMACWRAKGQWPSSGMAGTVVHVPASFAGPRKLGMLTADFNTSSREHPVQIITDNRCGICSRHEVEISRASLAPFLPHRLRLAYGVWTEPDGAKVLFSRDYVPMWRLQDGLPPQPVALTDWIKFEQEEWFWEDATAPWEDLRRIAEEEARLKSYGINGLPALVDLLPIMVASVGNVRSPRQMLEDLRRTAKPGRQVRGLREAQRDDFWKSKMQEPLDDRPILTTGILKKNGDKFVVEYESRGIYVQWLPGEAATAAKPERWIRDAFPRPAQAPEHILRDLIGSRARFSDVTRVQERTVELPGKLDDGGTISIGYFKGRPAQVLSAADLAEAPERLREWANSYLRSDV
jgi:hypothetical protein